MKLAIIGVTGLVGQEMLKVLEEFKFPLDELIPVASKKSAGTKVKYLNESYTVITLEEALQSSPDVALFSAGGSISLEWVPKFAAKGCRVIDNSSAFRMDEDKKLIIPEINGDLLTEEDFIIANPNCSTIQMLIALAPLHKLFQIKRIVVSTYQSISGTGAKAIEQMERERNKTQGEVVYPYPIDQNVLPHCDSFLENGYTKEEMKLINETHKILDPSIRVTATAVRVPVIGGHSESINVSFKKEYDLAEVRKVLYHSPGVEVKDNPETNIYPMPLYARGKNEVFVGRLRRDESQENSLNMWVVADNLRKGAALNTVQIMLKLIEKRIVVASESINKQVHREVRGGQRLAQLKRQQTKR